MNRTPALRRSVLLLATAAALAACHGDDPAPTTATAATPGPAAAAPAPAPSPAPSSVALTGIAAVGEPVVAGTVSARCASGGAVAPATTDTAGHWTLALASAASLPCALQVSGGSVAGAANAQLLHSYASAAGNVNITPVTDMAVALAAASTPASWFGALDAAHPPALAATLEGARTQVLQALAGAGYTLPAGSSFDPLTAAFAASTGDPYDALLDAFGRGLASSGSSYAQLLNDVLAAASGGRPVVVPGVGIAVPGTPPAGQGGPIVLVAKSGVQPADIAALVGSYTGTLGSAQQAGQAAVLTDSCSIVVSAGGNIAVSAGGRTIGAPMNGDVGDQIITINTINKASAFDFATSTNAMVEVVRGHVALATASDPGGAVQCTLPNPHVTTAAGSATVQQVNGATAADFDAALVGSYANASCTVTLSSSGRLRIVSGSVDVQGTLGGDEQDVTTVFPSIGGEALSTEDLGADGRRTTLSFTRTAANASLNVPVQYAAAARITEPRPVQTLANCQSLVRQ